MEQTAIEHSDTDTRLAQRLHQLRVKRSWSLEELATKSGVSRATLSRIENNEVSPTASVLGRLCAAFELTMSRLLAYVESDLPALVPRNAQPVWIDPETGFRRRSISPPSPDFDCELLECELPAGALIDYPLPPRPGLEHHLYLQEGALELTIEGQVHRMSAGDCLRYKLVGASSFLAAGRRPARYILILR